MSLDRQEASDISMAKLIERVERTGRDFAFAVNGNHQPILFEVCDNESLSFFQSFEGSENHRQQIELLALAYEKTVRVLCCVGFVVQKQEQGILCVVDFLDQAEPHVSFARATIKNERPFLAEFSDVSFKRFPEIRKLFQEGRSLGLLRKKFIPQQLLLRDSRSALEQT